MEPGAQPIRRETVIELRGLAKSFRTGIFHEKRVESVRGVDLDVYRGEIFGFVGPNGAGKTTVIKMLVGLLHPSRGTARILGRSLPDREVQRHIGFLPEIAHYYEYLTGLELLDFHGRLLGLTPAVRQARITRLIERVGMAGRADRPLRKFSKGMQQRIGLAQALLGEPEFLVLDEPMSGLDPIGRHDIRTIILEEQRRGTTVFFSSHILSDVEQLCDRIGIMINGVLRSVGPIHEIKGGRLLSVEITLTGWTPQLGDRLPAPQVLEVRHHEGELTTLLLAPEVELDGAIQTILAQGGHPREIKRHQQSLEEIFLKEAGR